MARWEKGARERLQQAALDLFTERGFENTTVTDIAERAGLTKRTFFRYFNDKQEVLFAGEAQLPTFIRQVILDAPPEQRPAAVIASSLKTTVMQLFDGRRTELIQRRQVVQAATTLLERDLAKLGAISTAAYDAFQERGADHLTAAVAAQLAVSAFKVTLDTWLTEPDGKSLAKTIDDVLRTHHAVALELQEAAPETIGAEQ